MPISMYYVSPMFIWIRSILGIMEVSKEKGRPRNRVSMGCYTFVYKTLSTRGA